MKPKMLYVMFIAIVIVGCTGSGPSYQVRTLSSGRPLRVLGVMKMSFPKGGPALMLQYQTDIKMDDVAALRKEADDIWTDFKGEVERSSLSNAILSAHSIPQGAFIKREQSYNFAFVKSSTGEWKCSNDD
jgi:hypothetical protein